MRKIETIEEIHHILLSIVKEFHKICVDNNIPYYLLYGSMLGAVRHKGFIPWDDDMDVAIESQYYTVLLSSLKKHLPPYYRVLTRYDTKGVPGGYIKIEDTRTLLVEECLNIRKCTGVFLDVFLLYPSDGKTTFISRFNLCKMIRYVQMNRFYKLDKSNPIDCFFQILIKMVFFWLKKPFIINIMEKYIIPQKGDYFSTYVTIYNEKDVIPKKYYGSPQLIKFEDTYLYGVEDYDSYLSHIYNDYMMLPPKEKRRIHLSAAYYR